VDVKCSSAPSVLLRPSNTSRLMLKPKGAPPAGSALGVWAGSPQVLAVVRGPVPWTVIPEYPRF
jgi:hypothetical protein